MGRFKPEGIIIRRVKNLTIVFYDRYSIYVYPDVGFGCVFHRWGQPRGSYARFKLFRKRLMYNKSLSFGQCCSLAVRHEILAQGTDRKLDLKGRKVIYRK